jgi:hypothetical protein
MSEIPKHAIAIEESPAAPTFLDLTQKAFFRNPPRDARLEQLFEPLMSWRDDEVSFSIRDTAGYYNTLVGNQVRGQSIACEKNKSLLEVCHITAWYQLRFIHCKSLMFGILSLLNYFEYIVHTTTASEKPEFNIVKSKYFSEVIEI